MSATTLYQSANTQTNFSNCLKPGPSWSSFEKFRLSGTEALKSINSGRVGILRVKGSQYRILEESDFQSLLGLATEVERLQKGLKVVLCAARVVEMMHKGEEPSPDIETLKAAVSMIVTVPELPVRRGSDYIEPEGLFQSEDTDEDEVELDNITRPLTNA